MYAKVQMKIHIYSYMYICIGYTSYNSDDTDERRTSCWMPGIIVVFCCLFFCHNDGWAQHYEIWFLLFTFIFLIINVGFLGLFLLRVTYVYTRNFLVVALFVVIFT